MTADLRALGPLLLLFGYLLGAHSELLAGTHKLRYSRVLFARKLPTWSMVSPSRRKCSLVFQLSPVEHLGPVHCVARGAGGLLGAGGPGGCAQRFGGSHVCWRSWRQLDSCWKRVRLKKETLPVHQCFRSKRNQHQSDGNGFVLVMRKMDLYLKVGLMHLGSGLTCGPETPWLIMVLLQKALSINLPLRPESVVSQNELLQDWTELQRCRLTRAAHTLST